MLDANSADITDVNHIGVLNPFRYRGYFYDEETGLYYLKSRYYDPEVGRFITIDGVSYIDPETINGLNLYAYCGNNPVMYTDPNGTAKWWEWLLGALVIVVVAALVVATAGVAAVAIGATAATVNAVMIGAAAGSLVAGGTNLLMQGITTDWQTVDYCSIALSTFVGGVTGAISGGFGQLSAGVTSGTRLLVHKGFQTAVNVMLSWGGYVFSSAVSGEDLTIGGLIFATFGGIISGVAFNWATIPALGLLVGLEFAGYIRDIIDYIRDSFKISAAAVAN